MKSLVTFFFMVIVLALNSIAECVAPLQELGDAGPPGCEVEVSKEAIFAGEWVKATLKAKGRVQQAYLDGVPLGAGGGAIRIRLDRSRWIVGSVQSGRRSGLCFAPVAVVTGGPRRPERRLVQIRSAQGAPMAANIRILPESRSCNLGEGTCVAESALGLLAIVSQIPGLTGYSCNEKFFPARAHGDIQVAHLSVEEDLVCEPNILER